MAIFAETADAVFDVIDGGFQTKPTLGLQGLWLPLCGSSKLEIQGYADSVEAILRPVRQTWHGLPESQAQAAGFSGKFAGSSVYPPGLIEVEHKSIALDGGRLKQGQQFFEGLVSRSRARNGDSRATKTPKEAQQASRKTSCRRKSPQKASQRSGATYP